MRLVGVSHEDSTWIAVERDAGLFLLATVTDFYANPYSVLADSGRTDGRLPLAPPWQIEVPIPRTAKVLCAGLNYRAHAAESGVAVPAYPDVFGRWASTLVPTGTPVPVPAGEPGLDWEGELAVIIGRELHNASPEEVEDAVIGYTCFNDISARTHQLNAGQWTIGKNADNSGPFGPVMVTRDEVQDPYALRIQTRLDGEVVQDALASEMIFTIGQIGAYISECITLHPGDVIATGTPEGIGATRRPPVYMQPGQLVEVEIDQIGVLYTPVAGPSPVDRLARAASTGQR